MSPETPKTAPPKTHLVRLVARKELLDHLLSLKFHICIVAMAMLMALSAFVMYRDYQVRMEIFASMRERAKPRPQEDLMAVVEPRRLSVFAKGLDEILTRGYTVTAYNGIEPHEWQTPTTNLFALFSPPDLLYIVKVLLSLIAILFAYDAVCGEKEAGTLKLVLASAMSRGKFVAGKLLGGLAAVLIPFFTLWIGLLIVLALLPGFSLTGGDFARVGLMFLATVIYIALFFSLGVVVSAQARSSAGALVSLLFLWAAIVFGIPSVANLLAEQISPPPSAETQVLLRRQAFVKSRFVAIQTPNMGRDQSFADFNRDYDRLVEDYRSKLDAMISTSKNLCRISPAATLTYIFTNLAGTGLDDQHRLALSLMDFKNRNLSALTQINMRYVPAFTPFEFRPLRLGDVFAEGTATDFALLVLVGGVLMTAAVFAFLRVDPR